MLKSIKESRDAQIIRKSGIKRNFTSCLNDIKKMDEEINRQVAKLEYKSLKVIPDTKPLKNKVLVKRKNHV